MSSTVPSTPISSASACWQGMDALWKAKWPCKLLVGLLFLVLLLMFPAGRTNPEQVGGAFAPLSVDSGYLFRQRPAADFFSVYDAGSRILRFQDPYGVNQVSGGEGLRAPYVATFRYLPITAVWLAVPLNILPPWPAYYTWAVLNLIFIALNFFLCVGRRPDRIPIFALIWFAWFPVFVELHMGQFTLFMATLMLWGMDGIRSGRYITGSAGWILATMLKVYPIAMAPSLWLWGRWKAVLLMLLLVVGTTVLWRLAVPSEFNEGVVNRGIAGRVIGQSRQPYAGAMGCQEMVNAVVWKLKGNEFSSSSSNLKPLKDPVFIINALVLGLYGLICLWALIRTRKKISLAAIGLFWMSWFFAYVDCWEHHYVLIQSLVALLLAWRVINWPTALCCWLFAGTPSLWYLWNKAGYTGNFNAELLGTLYFLQRPIALFLLTGILSWKIYTEGKGKP